MRFVVVVVAALLIAAAPARASAPYAIWGIDANGDPSLTASDSEAIVTVSRCADGGPTCVPVTDQAAGDGSASATPGETAAGTVFEAAFAYMGQPTVTWRSPAWDGRFAMAAPPTLTGAPVVGGSVVPVAGTTVGGWHGAVLTVPGVQACSQPAGGECWTIASSGASGPIDPRWAGSFLAAIEWGTSASIQGNPPIPPVPALPPLPWGPYPWAQTPPNSGAFVSRSSFSGPVAAIPGPLTPTNPTPAANPVKLPAAPTAAIRKRALRGKGRLSVARVTCAKRCTVRLTVSGGGKTLRRTLSVTGTRALTIPPRHGKLKVRVVVGGKTLARGFSRAR